MTGILASIALAAQLSGVSPDTLTAICFQESSLRPKTVVHHDGGSASYGLCQVKFTTAREIFGGITRTNLLDPFLNALVAGKYLNKLKTRYNGNKDCAINSYNTGPRKTKCTKETSETKYVKAVRKHMRRKPWLK